MTPLNEIVEMDIFCVFPYLQSAIRHVDLQFIIDFSVSCRCALHVNSLQSSHVHTYNVITSMGSGFSKRDFPDANSESLPK